MNNLTKIMIKKYALKKLKYDFMGYDFRRPKELTFHHLIVPHCICKCDGLGEGYILRNGVILKKDSHDYLHLIEKFDEDIFYEITSELLDENLKGHIDLYNIYKIDELLCLFEIEYCNKYYKGKPLIKEEYVKRLKR